MGQHKNPYYAQARQSLSDRDDFEKLQQAGFEALENMRRLLRTGKNIDLMKRMTPGAPMLQSLGEVAALMGIPVDLTLTPAELVKFIQSLNELLFKRATIEIWSDPNKEKETAVDRQALIDTEVAQELATGIIVEESNEIAAQSLVDEHGNKLIH